MMEDDGRLRTFLIPTSEDGVRNAQMYEGDGFVKIAFPSPEFYAIYNTALDDLCEPYDEWFDDVEDVFVDKDLDYVLELAEKYADDSPSFLKAAKLAKEYGYGIAFYM